jgi:hypothetical protein
VIGVGAESPQEAGFWAVFRHRVPQITKTLPRIVNGQGRAPGKHHEATTRLIESHTMTTDACQVKSENWQRAFEIFQGEGGAHRDRRSPPALSY